MESKMLPAIVMLLSVVLSGCSGKTVRDVGGGMQVGAAGGTPLAPFVAGAGAFMMILGDLLPEGKSTEGGGSLKWFVEEQSRKGGTRILLREKLHPTEKTSDEEISSSAVAVCREMDDMVEKQGYITISRQKLSEEVSEELVADVTEEHFQVPLPQNPYGNDCVEAMTDAGRLMVSLEKNKTQASK